MNAQGKKPSNMLEKALEDTAFKPILIDELGIKLLKEDERGKMYLLRNPNNSKYVKMHESVLEILKAFDSKKSLEDISQLLKSKKVEVDAKELVKMLAEEGFIKNISISKKKDRGDIFSFKIKLFKTTEKGMGLLEKLFFFGESKGFLFFYVAFVAVGFSLFVYNFPRIFSTIIDLMNPETALLPLFVSSLMFYIVEFAHEFAHAVAYYHYGGKSSEIGIEFHFFVPFFYTSTLDAMWMETRKQIMIFIAGPLASFLFAEIFTLLFIFEPTFRIIWAAHAFFWHISTLITLSPIIRTDGYFVVQAITRFPNLLEHGVSTLSKAFQAVIGKISLKDFNEHMSQYSTQERKILKCYVPLLPIVTGMLVYFFVYTGLEFGLVEVLNMTPSIITGTAEGIKPYALWILYILSLAFSLAGVIGTLVNTMRKMKEK